MKKVNKIIKIPKLLPNEVVNATSQHEEGDFEFEILGRDRMNIFGQQLFDQTVGGVDILR